MTSASRAGPAARQPGQRASPPAPSAADREAVVRRRIAAELPAAIPAPRRRRHRPRDPRRLAADGDRAGPRAQHAAVQRQPVAERAALHRRQRRLERGEARAVGRAGDPAERRRQEPQAQLERRGGERARDRARDPPPARRAGRSGPARRSPPPAPPAPAPCAPRSPPAAPARGRASPAGRARRGPAPGRSAGRRCSDPRPRRRPRSVSQARNAARRMPSSGRSQRIPSRRLAAAMPASPSTPEPRASRIRKVSA